MSLSKSYIDLQELLIEPNNRVKFITKFVLITSLGNLALVYFCDRALTLFKENNLITLIFGGLISVSIVSLFIGTCSGILQWMALRKYFNREWIMAIALNGSYFGVNMLRSYFNLAMFSNYPNQNNLASILGLVLAILSISLLVTQGFIQKLTFKSKIEKANWLIYLPAIAALFSGFQYLAIAIVLWFVFQKHLKTGKQIICYLLAVKSIDFLIFFPLILTLFSIDNQLSPNLVSFVYQVAQWLAFPGLSLINNDINIFWYRTISSIFIFSTIQGLAICFFHRQYPRHFSNLDKSSAFASTPDFESYTQVQSAMKKAAAWINRLWQRDLNSSFDLTYWLVVLFDGSIVAYYPTNQVSQDGIDSTPLSLLRENSAQSPNVNLDQTAKLQITFVPPGAIKINSLSGIPFSWLLLSAYVLLVIVSIGLTLILQNLI